jgi:hypothetical protein
MTVGMAIRRREEESDAYYTGYGARYVYEQMETIIQKE